MRSKVRDVAMTIGLPETRHPALYRAVLALVCLMAPIATAAAHSLSQLQDQIYKDEPFFQVVNREAPKFELQDADGHAVGLSDFTGKVVVLHFIYASCTDFCPLHSELLAQIQKMIDRTPMRDRVEFVSITTDPARDTPEILKEYGPLHGLDPRNWVFLTTRPGQPEDATRQLAESFGHKFTKAEDGEYMHGVVTHIIDREGELRGNFHGLNFDPVNLVTFVNALTNDVHKPSAETSAMTSPMLPAVWLALAVGAGAVAWVIGRRTFGSRA